MPSLRTHCAACRFLRRKCPHACVFAPHFPPERHNEFACVHKVFGASNVAKLLNDLPFNQREDAVNSLVYDAENRLCNPVYGSAGLISMLQHRHTQLQHETENSRKELATYVSPQAMLPILQPPQPYSMSPPPQSQRPYSSSASVLTQHHHNLVPTGQSYHQQQQQQIFEAQQLAAVNALAREQHNEMFRAYGEGSITAVTVMPLGDNFADSPWTNNSYYTDQQLHHYHQHQHHEAQQLAAVNAVAREQQNEIFRAYGEGRSSSSHHQNQGQVKSLRFNNGFDSVPAGSVTFTGFNQLSSGGTAVTEISLGNNFVDSPSANNSYYTDQQLHHHHQHQHCEAQQLHHHHQHQHPEAQQLYHHHQHQHHEAQQLHHHHQHQHHEAQQLHHHHQHQHHEAQQIHHHHQQQHHEAQQLHHHHQHQHHEAQLFIPTQSSQPLPLQKQESQTQTQPSSESEEGTWLISLNKE